MSSRPPYRSLSLALLLGLGLGLAGCPAGSGATCQITSDCAAGLSCCNDGLPRGTCQSVCPQRPDAAVDDAGATVDAASAQDAASAVDALGPPDATSDGDGGT
ncbi:MAG: hypothetical protein OHK0013_21300 [Sandaracinaceae bacterium]